jgi:hypothetical protein
MASSGGTGERILFGLSIVAFVWLAGGLVVPLMLDGWLDSPLLRSMSPVTRTRSPTRTIEIAVDFAADADHVASEKPISIGGCL